MDAEDSRDVDPFGADVASAWRESEANFFRLLDSSPDAFVLHRERRIVYTRSRAYSRCSATRLSPRSPGDPIFEFVSTAYRALVADRVFQT